MSLSTHSARLAKAIERSYLRTAMMETVHGAYVAPLKKLAHGRDGKLGTFDGGAYYSDGAVCRRALHLKNGFQNIPAPVAAPANQFFSGKHLFGGLLKNEHFGHFLAESLSRLWALGYIDPSIRSVVYYVRDVNRPIPSFVWQMMESIRPGLEIRLVSELSQFETLIVPDQIAHPEIGFISGNAVVRELFAHFRVPKPNMPEKVYISRSKLNPNEAGIVGEQVLERNLANEGYEIIHPQLFSIQEQLDIYASAKKLIFAEGSPLHLYVLACQPEQELYVLRRRTMSIVFDWQIASFGGPKVQGNCLVKEFYSPEKDAKSLLHAKALLGFDELRNELREAGFIGNRPWRAPSKAQIQTELKEAEELHDSRLMSHVPELAA